MFQYLRLTVCMLLLAAAPASSQQSGVAGRVKVTSGAVYVVRSGTEIRAQAGQLLYQADVIRTGADGGLGITLKDDTRVSLGPSSELRIDRFSYAPAEGHLALALNVVRGVVAYVSGRIAKLAPDNIRIETPSAILGVRGTTLAIRVDAI
jgi:hypothetical protein